MPQSLSEIRKAYHAAAKPYASKFLGELDHKPLDKQLLERFAQQVKDNGRVIDLGCGPGHTTAYLASLGLNPVGVDLANGMISEAQSNFPSVDYVVADFFNLPMPENTFAGCLAFYCIVHLQNAQLIQAFSEMHRVLLPDGTLLVSFHVGSEPVVAEDFLDTGNMLEFFTFPMDVLICALTESGFAEIEPLERSPYETEYPSQRGYVFAKKPAV